MNLLPNPGAFAEETHARAIPRFYQMLAPTAEDKYFSEIKKPMVDVEPEDCKVDDPPRGIPDIFVAFINCMLDIFKAIFPDNKLGGRDVFSIDPAFIGGRLAALQEIIYSADECWSGSACNRVLHKNCTGSRAPFWPPRSSPW